MDTGLLILTLLGLVVFPILGNLRPDLVSFLPSLRQYAGNWASAAWWFAPGAEAKLDEHITKPCLMQKGQLTAIYGEEAAEVVMQQLVGWRSLHSQARGLNSVAMTVLGDDIDVYTPREAEFSCNAIIGVNFGDGHLHNHVMLEAVQQRRQLAPGEVLVVTGRGAAEALGGGTRSSELTLPGLIHDECSEAHPLAIDTPFSRRFDLAAHGLAWRWPDVQFSHPLDGGGGASARRSVEETAAGLGERDGKHWRSLFGALSERFDDISEDFWRPVLHLPKHPIHLARFGACTGPPAAVVARRFRTPEGRALFAGVAAHAMRPFGSPMSAAIGVTLGTAAHRYGWPVAEGGSSSIRAAMISLLEELGASFETGFRVTSLDELGSPDIVMLDVTPAAAVAIAGERIPRRVARALTTFRHGPGVFKVDFAVQDGVPWAHEDSRHAGTVHVGGTYDEIAAAEHMTCNGQMPDS